MRLLRLPGVFQPHSDSWLLAEQAVREPVPKNASVLDLCAGSGVVALAAARRNGSRVAAVDVSLRAVLTIAINAKLNGVEVKALRGNLFEPVHGSRFDLIVSNPPYLPDPDGRLPRGGASRAWEAGADGRAFIDRICAQAQSHLHPGGVLLLVQSSVCGEGQTLDLLARHGLSGEVVVRKLGPLGPRLSAREAWLRERSLIGEGGMEEMLIIRAEHLQHPLLRVDG